MSETFSNHRLATFIVRLSWPRTGGGLTGIVERVATGEKRRFHDAKRLGRVIESLVQAKRNGRRGAARGEGR